MSNGKPADCGYMVGVSGKVEISVDNVSVVNKLCIFFSSFFYSDAYYPNVFL